MYKSVCVIGLGNMGKAIASSLANDRKVFGIDPLTKENLSGIKRLNSYDEALLETDWFVLAVKPQDVKEVCQSFHSPIQLFSIAAGITTRELFDLLPQDSKVVRLMPNLPLVVGQGAIGYYAKEEMKKAVVEIFGRMGTLVSVKEESLLDAVTGLSGSGPAYVLTFLQALAEGGVKSGLNYNDALLLAMQTIQGTLAFYTDLLGKDPKSHPMEVRNWVTSPGGTTIHGLHALEEAGFASAVWSAVEAATQRSKELGKKR